MGLSHLQLWWDAAFLAEALVAAAAWLVLRRNPGKADLPAAGSTT